MGVGNFIKLCYRLNYKDEGNMIPSCMMFGNGLVAWFGQVLQSMYWIYVVMSTCLLIHETKFFTERILINSFTKGILS